MHLLDELFLSFLWILELDASVYTMRMSEICDRSKGGRVLRFEAQRLTFSDLQQHLKQCLLLWGECVRHC